MKPLIKKMLVTSVLLVPLLAQADEVRMYRSGEIPDSSDIARMLGGGNHGDESKPRMRGISLDPAYDSKASQPRVPRKSLDEIAGTPPKGFAIPVQFAFDSSEILPEATPQLDAVAKGIKIVRGTKVIVEGHTDAYGTDLYNESLSRRRAAAVKRYLVEKHGIDRNMLTIVGMGEWAPIDNGNPYDAENRRVQFRAVR